MGCRLGRYSLAGLGITFTLGACAEPPVQELCLIPDQATPAERTAALARCQAANVHVPYLDHKEIDILFLIDNSPSMTPKQKALAQNIPKFIQKIDATGANYHVGIATSDIGTTIRPGAVWGGGLGKCDSYAGDDGLLQTEPCTQRTGVSASALAACNTLCPDERYVPLDGRRYIARGDGLSNVPAKLELDTMTGKMIDVGPIKAFQCMALVGDGGCGIEGQLEGAKRALDGHRADNAGFLRPNSFLAVIYITDEDDCSVQEARRNENNPQTRQCDPTQPDASDCFSLDYRCLARSVQCSESMMTPGVKSACRERPDNYLDPVEKYYKFFSSLRPASRLLISGIWTLPSITSGGRLEIEQPAMTSGSAQLNRAHGTGASCSYTGDSSIFGQAQLRLSKFAQQFGSQPDGTANALEVSICDIDNYPSALDNIAKTITERLNLCLPLAPKRENGQPICVVGDVDASSPNASPEVLFPTCSSACCGAFAAASQPTPTDPAIKAACAAETTDACYCAVKSTAPIEQCPGTAVAGIWRKGGSTAPPGKVANFLCAGESPTSGTRSVPAR